MVSVNQGSVKPSNDPNFLAYSRGVDVPDQIKPQGQAVASITPQGAKFAGAEYEGNRHIDESGKYAGVAQGLETAATGNLIQNLAGVAVLAAKGADTVIKDDIDNTTYTAVDRERQSFKAGLEQASGVNTTKMDVLSSGSHETIPDEVEGVGEAVGTLKAARDGGKISPTLYYARLDAIASSIRNRYPGYREYIDKQISQVSGVDPANAYIKSLMSDINRAQSASAGAANKEETFVKQNLGTEGVLDLWQQRKAGKVSMDDIYRRVSEDKVYKEQLNIRALERADRTGTRAEQAIAVADDATFEVNGKVNNWVKTFELTAAGTGDKMESAIQKLATGQTKYTPEEKDSLGQQIVAQKEKMSQEIDVSWNIRDKNGKTQIDYMGGKDKADKLKADLLQPMDRIADLIYNEKWGAAGSAMRAVKGQVAQSKYNLMNSGDPEMDAYWRNVAAVNELGSNFDKAFFDRMFINGIGKSKQNIGDKMKTYIEKEAAGAVTGNLNSKGAPYSAAETIKQAQAAGVKDPAVFDAIVKIPTLIPDKSFPDAAKANLINYTFGPANRGVLDQVVADGRDPATGRPIPGKMAVFKAWTAPDITAEVIRLDKQDPSKNLWPNYKNWVEETFQNQLMSREVRDLNTIQVTPGMKITWNTETNEFDWKIGNKSLVNPNTSIDVTRAEAALANTPVNRAAIQRGSDAIRRLNEGLRSVSNVAKAGNEDVESYLLKTLFSMGFDPSIRDVEGIPGHMMAAIKASRALPPKKESTYK